MRGIPQRIKNARNAQTRRSTALQAQSTKITTCVSAICFAGHINHLQEYDTIVCGKRQFAAEDISSPLKHINHLHQYNTINRRKRQFAAEVHPVLFSAKQKPPIYAAKPYRLEAVSNQVVTFLGG